jgi:serine/threonine protein kinase
LIGTTVQHYRIGERLGAGGMGEVYKAEDVRLGRPVALKFLPHELKTDPESRARLLNEARAASLLRSPNIAVTYDIGEVSGSDFIVMEYVDGELLSSRVSKGPLAIREVIEIGLQVTDALEEAHGRGIVHRDVKSANLMRTERGLVKVLDFGLAKFVKPDGADAARVTQPQVTIAGMVVGTVSYMAPEQALGRPVDHRTDLFSLGVVLFELATGRIPFTGGSPTEIIDHILHEIPPPPSRLAASTPPSFDAVVARALEKSPTFRYQSARDMHEDLRHVAAELDTVPRGTTSRIAAGHRAIRGGDDVRQHHPRAGRRLDRDGHRRNRQLGSQERPRADRHRPRARVRRAAQPLVRRAPRRVAGHRRRPPARRDVGGGRRLPAHRRAGADHGELRRRRDR